MTDDPKQERKNEETPKAASAAREEQAVRTEQARPAEQGLPQQRHTEQERRTESDRRADGDLRADGDRRTDGDLRTDPLAQRPGSGAGGRKDPLTQERSGTAAAGPEAGRGRTPETRGDVKPLHAREPQETTAGGPAHDPGATPDRTPDRTPGHKVPGRRGGESSARLLPQGDSEKLTQRLQEALNTFVDEPRRSVEEAAGVLEEAAERLTSALAERHRSLRAGWDAGSAEGKGGSTGGADTEDLRLALQTYREVTERLLQL